MNALRLAFRSLVYHWRGNCAVALGVMAATAVLTGALVVGDSMQGSLRQLALDRLGSVDEVLVAPRLFSETLAKNLRETPEFQKHFSLAVPAIMLPATLENPQGKKWRAGGVNLIGADADFWKLGDRWKSGQSAVKQPPSNNQIVLNQPLAEQLHVQPGDEVIVRLPLVANVPADSPLGKKTETVRNRRFKVSEIIPATGLGRFGLRPTQQMPLNAYTAVSPLAQMLDADGKVDAILVGGRAGGLEVPSAAAEQALQQTLRPTLADYGLAIHKTVRGYINITTDRMVLEPSIAAAALKALAPEQQHPQPQPVFTYLANYILADNGRGKIPYSTVAAIDFTSAPPLGPFVNREGKPIPPLADDEIVLNSWAADDLAMQGVKLQPGDPIELTYFEPESTHGKVVETRHVFHLKDIVQLAGAAADRDLTPEVKGVTDEASIADWNPPFPYDQNRVRATPPNNQDDDYWRKYRATPKAFVSLSEGQKLWGSRFGNITSIRISPDVNSAQSLSEQAVADRLLAAFQPAALGFEFLPVKRLSLAAAAGTTPFAMLFLAFSFFIIAAALVLVILLFKLAIDMRATELGIILAVGLRRSFARRMLLIEGFGIALVGALAGILAGIGYAWLMLVGLKTWWLGAISTPFLELYVQPQSLIIGFACGLVAALATIVWALRQTRRVSARQLMAGQIEPPRSSFARQARWTTWIVAALVVMAVGSSVAAFFMNGEAQAGAFMGAGALVLAALLVWQRDLLRYGPRFLRLEGNSGSLVRLALRNVGRNPLRSILTISLTASACFLIFAVSAFQLDPPKHGPSLTSGDGGFALVANSDQPIYQDINSEVNGKPLGTESFPLRVQAGDDASCLNLYQPRQPRVLGVPENLIQRGGFAWGANTAETQDEKQNPWLLLNGKSVDRRGSQPGNASASSSDADAIPVVLDQNTAMYSLHLGEGAGQIFEIDHPSGGKIKLQVIGVLTNSIFQGDLLMSEANFLRTFPGASGYQFFLIDCPADKLSAVADSLESTYGDEGLEVQTTAARLAAFFVVQNTYLATFRSLGGLGLLLGTFGLAAVQLRSIVERRGELALLQAVGFRRRRLALLVLLEQAALLLAGLATGALAALVALAPHLLAGGAGIPWWSLATTLAVIFAVGLLAGSIAVKAVLKAPVLAALRGS